MVVKEEEEEEEMTLNVHCEKIILAKVMWTDGKGAENRCVDQLRGGQNPRQGSGVVLMDRSGQQIFNILNII